mgnify:CR=1 FL=1
MELEKQIQQKTTTNREKRLRACLPSENSLGIRMMARLSIHIEPSNVHLGSYETVRV